jgi:hypothetical protein
MSQQANEAHVQEYTTRTEHLLQQRGSKLFSMARQMGFVGKAAQVVQQYGAVEAQEIVNRHADTVLTDTPQTSRWIRPSDWGVADMVDKQDLIRSLTDPKSDFALAQAMGLGRKQDELFIAAALGTNFTGEDGGTSVTAAADGVLVVDSAGTARLTTDKLRETRKNFAAAEVDLDREMLFFAYTAEQEEDILGLSEAITIDSNSSRILVDGKVRPFLGFNFIRCELLEVNASSNRRCIAWAQSGIVAGTWDGISADVGKRPDKWNNIQVATTGTFGVTRTEGLKVQEVVCDEA